MTSVEIIGAEVTRLVNQLTGIDPVADTDRYHKIIDCAHGLMALGYTIDEHNQRIEDRKTAKEYVMGGFINPDEIPVHPVDDPFPEPSTEEYTAPVMEPAVTTTKIADSGPTVDKLGDPAPTFTKEEVRAALAKSRKKGINVTELLCELGYDNFTAVPAAKYGEVMAKLGEV